MSADPYTTVEDWVTCLDLPGMGATTCAAEAHGDQWDNMDAHLAEQPWPTRERPRPTWPDLPFVWDATEDIARFTAQAVYRGLYPWGVLVLVSRGAQHERRHGR